MFDWRCIVSEFNFELKDEISLYVLCDDEKGQKTKIINSFLSFEKPMSEVNNENIIRVSSKRKVIYVTNSSDRSLNEISHHENSRKTIPTGGIGLSIFLQQGLFSHGYV